MIERDAGLLALTTAAAQYEDRIGPTLPMLASVFKEHSAAKPWQALMDGWDIEHLTGARFDLGTNGRLRYFYEMFTCLWSTIWPVAGTPIIPLEVPQFDRGELVDFMAPVGNNPLRTGSAVVTFGLAKADRVRIDVYDVTGRRLRGLVDQTFSAGPHRVVWDGTDDSGHPAPRGVYFTRVKYLSSAFAAARKLIVLK